MPIVSFTERDLRSGVTVTPGWYRVNILSVGEAPAKPSEKGPSTNYPVEAVILFNGDNGDKTLAGTPLYWNFNSKAIGFAVGFLQALGVEVIVGQRFDLNAAAGMSVDVFVENDLYQGRTVNRINHKYRAPRPDVTAK